MERFLSSNMFSFEAAKWGVSRHSIPLVISTFFCKTGLFSVITYHCILCETWCGHFDLHPVLCWIFSLILGCRCCRYMIIPDMLKNAPMFKRLDAKIKVTFVYCFRRYLRCSMENWVSWGCRNLLINYADHMTNVTVSDLQGKGSSGVGVGRGRASAMQAKVSKLAALRVCHLVLSLV